MKSTNTLKAWFAAAVRHGRVYYVCESLARSGMSASYTLWTVRHDRQGRAYLDPAWPFGADGSYDAALAKRLGFRLGKQRRVWVRGGCGYDRVHDILQSIARECTGNGDINGLHIESLHR